MNDVLAQSLPKQAYKELTSLHAAVHDNLPLKHQYSEPIPYHYSLIAERLDHAKYWGARQIIFDARPGDILIYMDPEYDPDPSQRQPGDPIGHVGFVDEIQIINPGQSLRIRLIDLSSRRRGRGHTENFNDNSYLKQEGNAYSILTLKVHPHQSPSKVMWETQFLGQEAKCKFINLIYPIHAE